MKRIHAIALITFLLLIASFGFAKTDKADKERVATMASQPISPTPTPARESLFGDIPARLRDLLSPVGVSVDESKLIDVNAVRAYRAFNIEWKAYKDAPEYVDYDSKKYAKTKELKVVDSFSRDGTLRKQLSLDQLEDEIFVTAVNANAQLLWWTRMIDPRLLRAEAAEEEGKLRNQLYHRSKVNIFVNAPEDEQITELRFYLPHWTGEKYTLEPLYTVPFDGKKKIK